jgi:H+-transporting ATPase
VKRDGKWTRLNCRELVTGDVIELKGGDVIPADAVVSELWPLHAGLRPLSVLVGAQLIGEGEPMKIDEAALTGESLPVTKRPGDAVLSGAIVTQVGAHSLGLFMPPMPRCDSLTVWQGELEARVTNIGADSFFGKTIALIEAGTDVGHLQIVSR